MKRFIFPLAVSLCLLIAVSHNTTVAAKDNWLSARTKNFFILGNASEKEIRQVGLKLEQFREAFTHIFPTMRFNTPVPTTVIVFKNDSSYRPFKPGTNVAGYFQPGTDVNYITLNAEVMRNGYGQRSDQFEVIYHEYTHLLVNNTFSNVPVWFNEGLAEYYSTFDIQDDQKVVIGRGIGNHVLLLRNSKMLPLPVLLGVDHKSEHYNEGNKKNIFYAQSWALMHYLIIGKEGRLEQLGKFLELMENKVPMEQAFQQAFETTYAAMEKELREYVKQDRYKVIRGHFERKLELDSSTQIAPLTEAEAQAYLGDLLLHSNRADSYTYLQKALKLDPNLAMAHASLGMAYFREGKVDEARASLERAVSLNTQNYLVHYYYAFTLSRSTYEEGPSSEGYPAERAAKIREHLQKAIALRPDYPESYSLLAFVSMVSRSGMDEALAALKKVVAASPGRHDLIYMLGQLYVHKGDYKTATQVLENIVKSNAEEQVRKRAESLLTQVATIARESARYEAFKEAAAKGSPVVVEQTTEPAPSDPSSYLREVLRKPATGETQLQGALLRIECDAKGMVFVVQTANGLLRLKSASFDDIELTTYDSKVQGEISCGARKPENAVIVCYVPNTDKRVKADGTLKSIEFVPSDFKLKP